MGTVGVRLSAVTRLCRQVQWRHHPPLQYHDGIDLQIGEGQVHVEAVQCREEAGQRRAQGVGHGRKERRLDERRGGNGADGEAEARLGRG
eukprot:scaffold700_cov39-Isochrysis_galbana.AAC.1